MGMARFGISCFCLVSRRDFQRVLSHLSLITYINLSNSCDSVIVFHYIGNMTLSEYSFNAWRDPIEYCECSHMLTEHRYCKLYKWKRIRILWLCTHCYGFKGTT